MNYSLFSKKRNNKSEELFHDEWAKTASFDHVDPNMQFEGPTSPEYFYAARLLKPIKNKKILVLGCGLGEEVVYLAKKGANVYALDISKEMLTFTKNLARHHNVQRKIRFFHVPAEEMRFGEECFDAVFACNLIHHIQVKQGIKKVHKVLKKGGVCVFLEPQADNLLINLYRAMASDVRTDNEHPITKTDIKLVKKYFSHVQLREFHLFTLLIFVWFYIGEGVHPNKERYWKKIIYQAEKYKKAFALLRKIDVFLLRFFPYLGRFCWV